MPLWGMRKALTGDVAVKRFYPKIKEFVSRADMTLFALCFISAIFGLVAISSATRTEGSAQFIIVQSFCLFLGIILFVVFTIIDLDIIADKWAVLLVFEVFLMLMLLTPLGYADDTGNRAWLRFGPIGVQPSEVVKVAFIVCMSKHMSYLKTYKNINSVISVGQLVIHCGFIVGMIVVISGDMGSALVFLFLFIVMLFAAGLKFYWFLIGMAGVAAVFPIFWTKVLNQQYRNRILVPYDSSIDPTGTGIGWQASQSKAALANGQFWGMGYGQGPQSQSDYLPAKQTDFIFSVIGEELGMIACLAVMALLLAIIGRCLYIGVKSKNTMSMLACFGVAGSMIFQTFENICMCIGVAPVIGITLPFFSYGGSSMFSMFAAMGLVSGVKYRPKPERFVSLR